MKSKPNYELKAQILSNHQDLLKLNKECLKCKNDLYCYHSTGKHINNQILTHKEAMRIYDLFMASEPDIWSECERINNATYARYKRLRNRIEDFILDGEACFVTCTFRDDVLASTSEATRRRYMTRFLKTQSNSYVANIDYGSLNDRPHYHGVSKTPFIDLTAWPYGWIYVEPIYNPNSVKLAQYVNKLTNHAIKATTKRNYGIYSKNNRSIVSP